jgi:hypothetical protein
MAGPSLVVRVLGDVTGLAKSFQTAGQKASGAASSMRTAFSGVLTTLNSTGVLGPFGDALAGVDAALGRIADHGKKIGPALLAGGGALAGIGAGLAVVGSKDQAAHAQLQAAVEATGKSYDDYRDKVESAIKSQEKYGHTADQTQDALRILTQATGDPAKALQFLNTATDLAAAKHEGLSEAATQLGKVYNGNGKLLKEFGLTQTKSSTATAALTSATKSALSADKNLAAAKQHLADLVAIDHGKKALTIADQIALRNAQQKVTDATAVAKTAHEKLTAAQDAAKNSANAQGNVMTALSGKLHGQASAAADTFRGHLDAIKAHLEDTAATFGKKYGPAITAAGVVMSGLGAVVTTTKGVLESFNTAEKGVKAGAEAATAAEVVQESASLPLIATLGLIVLAVAALVAIGYVIYRNWSTIWGGIKAIVKAVWDWIRANWPLLLGILLGPIGLAAALIWKYWKQIWDGVQLVWHWIEHNWPLLLAILTGPIGLAVLLIVRHWQDILGGLQAVWRWISSTWSSVYHFVVDPILHAGGDIVDFFTKLPGRIAGVISSLAGIIAAPFRFAIDLIIDAWNFIAKHTALHVHHKLPWPLPDINVDTPQLLPDIPKLAQGGLITSTGLVLAHAGEVIAPIEKVPRGPAVQIANAHFSSELDVESFMRRVAWTVQTQKI